MIVRVLHLGPCRLLVSALLLLAAAPAALQAATVPYRTDAQLAAMSERIVRGRVLSVRAEGVTSDGRENEAIFTIVRLAVLEDLTGGADPVIEIQELGGRVGMRRLVVPGTPAFVPGEELVLCLERGTNGRWRTVALGFSTFSVRRAGTDVTLSRQLAGIEVVPPVPQEPQAPQAGGAAPGGQAASASEAQASAARDDGRRSMAEFRQTVAGVKRVAPIEPAGAAALRPDAVDAAGGVSSPFTLLENLRWMQVDDGAAITWFLDPSYPPPTEPGVNIQTVIQRALTAWSAPPEASIALTFGGNRVAVLGAGYPYCSSTNADAGIIIFEDPGNRIEMNSGTLAIGGGCSDPSRTRVVNGVTFEAFTHGFVAFNRKAQIPAYIQTELNFGRVLTHEIGHGVGMGHTSVTGNLMLPSCCTASMPTPPSIGADDLAGISFIYPDTAPPPTDADLDNLPDAWEIEFGLNPNDRNGDNGPDGDPDHDGVLNRDELTNHTHPRGFFSRYFAEGAVNTFFDTQFAIVNYGASAARILLRLQPQADGVASTDAERPLSLMVPAQSRGTVTADMLRAQLSTAFATIIESDVPIVADRTMTWGGGYGSHAETAVNEPGMTWYFAEGATGPLFNLYYLLQNPHPDEVMVRVRYLRGGPLPPLEKDYRLPPRSRTTIDVRGERFIGDNPAQPGPLSIAEVSGIVSVLTANRPIIAERALYRVVPGQIFGAGHEGAGVPALNTTWFLAEGATGFFDEFILIANPNTSPVSVDVTYLLEGGGTRRKTYPVGPEQRFTIQVSEETIDGFSFRQAAFSTRLIANLPIIVERAMWWRSGTPDWVEAHNAAGATASGTRWALADGETGGARNTQTFILVANLGSAATRLRVTYFVEPGTCGAGSGPCAPIVWESAPGDPVAATSRQTINPADLPALRGRRFAAVVESLDGQPLVVERAMYSDAGGTTWAAGTAALGTLLSPMP